MAGCKYTYFTAENPCYSVLVCAQVGSARAPDSDGSSLGCTSATAATPSAVSAFSALPDARFHTTSGDFLMGDLADKPVLP